MQTQHQTQIYRTNNRWIVFVSVCVIISIVFILLGYYVGYRIIYKRMIKPECSNTKACPSDKPHCMRPEMKCVECETDEQCSSVNPGAPRCDLDTHTCFCTTDINTCKTDENQKSIQQGSEPLGSYVCSTDSNSCVQCIDNFHCTYDYLLNNNLNAFNAGSYDGASYPFCNDGTVNNNDTAPRDKCFECQYNVYNPYVNMCNMGKYCDKTINRCEELPCIQDGDCGPNASCISGVCSDQLDQYQPFYHFPNSTYYPIVPKYSQQQETEYENDDGSTGQLQGNDLGKHCILETLTSNPSDNNKPFTMIDCAKRCFEDYGGTCSKFSFKPDSLQSGSLKETEFINNIPNGSCTLYVDCKSNTSLKPSSNEETTTTHELKSIPAASNDEWSAALKVPLKSLWFNPSTSSNSGAVSTKAYVSADKVDTKSLACYTVKDQTDGKTVTIIPDSSANATFGPTSSHFGVQSVMECYNLCNEDYKKMDPEKPPTCNQIANYLESGYCECFNQDPGVQIVRLSSIIGTAINACLQDPTET